MTERPTGDITAIDWSNTKISFIPQRDDVSVESNEATIYSRRDLGFVIKTFTDPNATVAQLHIAERLQGLVPKMAAYEHVPIMVDHKEVVLDRCIVQEKVAPLDFIIVGKPKPDDVPRLTAVIAEKVELDKEVFARGLYVPDPKFLNYGLDSEGRIKLLDLGGIVADPFSDDGYLTRLMIRGAGHYFNYFALQTMFDRELLIPTGMGRELATTYQDLIGLVFDDAVNARTFLRSGPYLFNLVRQFGSRFIKIALEEIDKYSNMRVPDNATINAALVAKPQDWTVFPNGNIVLLFL